MNKLGLLVIFIILPVFLVAAVHAQSIPPPTVSSSTSSNGFSLGAINSSNSVIYAAFFALFLAIVFAIALNRTQLSSGSVAIAVILGAISFLVLYTNSVLLHFFLNTFIVLAFIGLILGILALVKSPRSVRLMGLIAALFLIYILFANDTGLTNAVNGFLHINILSILPIILGAVSILVIIVLILRGIRNHKSLPLRVVLAFILFLLITLIIPGFASFFFSPIVLIPLAIVIIVALYLIFGHPRLPKGDKPPKEDKIRAKVLPAIEKRKQANQGILNEYRSLASKKNLTPNEQLRVAQLKNKLAKEAWENVADRTKLTAAQYSKKDLANNRDLQKLTGFFSKDQALTDLKKKAKDNYKMSRAEKKQLKKQQKALDQKDTFVQNMGTKESGDLFDLAGAVSSNAVSDRKARKIYEDRLKKQGKVPISWAEKRRMKKELQKSKEEAAKQNDMFQMANAARNGALGEAISDKQARKMYDDIISKDIRNKNVNDLIQKRQELQDRGLNLSKSTREKLIKKTDKEIKKLTNNKVNPGDIDSANLRKEQIRQTRQEMSEDSVLSRAQLEAARRNAEAARKEAERQDMLREQAQMAEAARRNAEEDQRRREAMLNEQRQLAEAARQESLRREREEQQRQEELRQKQMLEEQANLAKAAKNLPNDKSTEDIRREVEKELKKPNKPSLFARFSSKSNPNGTGRRDVVQIGDKNEEASRQAGVDIYNAKRVAGVFSTQEERELQSLIEKAYQNPNGKVAQRQIDEIKKAQGSIIGNKDKEAARKALEELKKKL
jgi:hypothetical protein